MTVKEKAERYDKALEIARQYWNNRAMPIGTNFQLQRMFPELKKSEEDEKIRNFISNELACLRATDEKGSDRYEELTKAIDWLENQGQQKPVVIIPKFRVGDEIKTSNEESLTITKIDEKGYWSEDLFICGFDEECIWDLVGQKHADKIEAKFKVGDWITDNNSTFQIVKVENEWYYADDGDKICFDVAHQYYHLWTIQDAKDGDVLCTYECGTPKIVFILKGTPKKHYALSYYCYYNIMYPHFESDSEKGCLLPNDEDVKPATKEQCDVLMKAMADARYTFDFEKKELKKIEQEKNMDNKLTNFEHSLKHIMEEAIECGDTHNLKADADMLLRLAQKPNEWHREDEQNLNAWTEEDEKQARQIERIVHNDGCSKKLQEQIANWFESLKNRMQPKVEWSKEDEGYFKTIAHALSVLLVDPYFDEIKLKHFGWFSSLKERYTWKPTEEQIETLKCACGGNYVDLGILESLYNDLKKL